MAEQKKENSSVDAKLLRTVALAIHKTEPDFNGSDKAAAKTVWDQNKAGYRKRARKMITRLQKAGVITS